MRKFNNAHLSVLVFGTVETGSLFVIFLTGFWFVFYWMGYRHHLYGDAVLGGDRRRKAAEGPPGVSPGGLSNSATFS